MITHKARLGPLKASGKLATALGAINCNAGVGSMSHRKGTMCRPFNAALIGPLYGWNIQAQITATATVGMRYGMRKKTESQRMPEVHFQSNAPITVAKGTTHRVVNMIVLQVTTIDWRNSHVALA
jgi:hypothetical protein